MEISIPAIIGAVSNMVVGFLWYGPLLGKSWMKLVGISKAGVDSAKGKMPMIYGLTFLGALVEAHVLSYLINKMNIVSVVDGAWLGFWVGLGLVATTMLANYLYTNKPRNLYLIDMGYHLVALVLMGALITYLS